MREKIALLLLAIALLLLAGCEDSNPIGTILPIEEAPWYSGPPAQSESTAKPNLQTEQPGQAAASAEGPWFPDPCTALNCAGAYYDTITESNGVTYRYYTYDFTADYDTVAHFLVVYTEAMKTLGYQAKRLTPDPNELWRETYAASGCPAAEMGVFAVDAEAIANGEAGRWRIVLAVPEAYTFSLGQGAPGVHGGNTVCVGCHGTGKCAGCGGSGRANYGDGYEDCVLCDGNGICTVCDGAGGY